MCVCVGVHMCGCVCVGGGIIFVPSTHPQPHPHKLLIHGVFKRRHASVRRQGDPPPHHPLHHLREVTRELAHTPVEQTHDLAGG